MKKSLVALAVLASSGAVLAQVSIKGNLTAGFSQTQTPSSASAGVTSGFGVDTAEVTFAATEDLGGGMKAGASMGLVNVARGQAAQVAVDGSVGTTSMATGFGPANTSVYVSGDFGRITLATARGTDYLTGGVAFVGGTFQEGRALSARDTADSISYSTKLGSLNASLTYSEPNNNLGLGFGTSGTRSFNDPLQSNVAVGLRYTDGPLVADFGYAMYDEGDTATNAADKSDTRFAGSYDLGAFKVGGGWRQRAGKQGTRTDMGVSAALPMGALTLGANWVQRELSDYKRVPGAVATSSTNGLNVGYGLSANYALSKRTSFIADYTAYTQSSLRTEMTTVYNLFLSHSF